jgi:hypothetical protein
MITYSETLDGITPDDLQGGFLRLAGSPIPAGTLPYPERVRSRGAGIA